MNRSHLRNAAMIAALALSASTLFAAGPSVRTERTGILKNRPTVALGAFRVIFVTEDSIGATSSNNFGGGRATTEQDAALIGLEQPLMQKLTDSIYADFLDEMQSKGYTVLDSQKLAAAAPTYKSLDMTDNFQSGRWGTYVVPTGQTSIALAADESTAVGRGSKGGVFSGFKAQGQKTKKGEADKVLPEISKAANAPILGVTIVVSFAEFRGSGYSHWGQGAKTKILTGATINGTESRGPMVTGIQAWEAEMYHNCSIACPLSTLSMEGNIHNEAAIGELAKYDAKTRGDKQTNALGALTGESIKHKGYFLQLDAAAYEKNVVTVSQQANDLLVAALVKEK
jgi:hypothetical protein